jgi:hypothetical protein
MFENALVKEHQGIHSLVLGGRSDVCVHCEVSQERFDFGFGRKEVFTGPHIVETNKPNDPVQIGSLSVNGVVVQTEYLSDLIKEFWLLTFCRIRHIRHLWRWPEILDNRHRANLPENIVNITLSGQNGKIVNGYDRTKDKESRRNHGKEVRPFGLGEARQYPRNENHFCSSNTSWR